MGIREKISMGAAMILAACGQHAPQTVSATFRETVIDGRLGFRLWIPEPTWRHVTQHTSGITSVLLDERVYTTVDAMIELGIRRRHLPCSRQWLLSEIGPAETGGVLFVGICATPTEMKAVDDDRRANVI